MCGTENALQRQSELQSRAARSEQEESSEEQVNSSSKGISSNNKNNMVTYSFMTSRLVLRHLTQGINNQ